jgi:hypothetical protein
LPLGPRDWPVAQLLEWSRRVQGLGTTAPVA